MPKVVGSIPTAPTRFLIQNIGLAKTARQQKAAIRARAGRRRYDQSGTDGKPTACVQYKLRDVMSLALRSSYTTN